MNLGETLGKFTDWVTGTLVGPDEPYDIMDVAPGDFGETTYGVDSNAALQPAYSEAPRKTDRNKDNVKKLPGSNYKNHEIRLSEPRSFRDATEIVQQLLDNRSVVLNLHLLDKETAQKTIDFVCGASQALNGQPKKVGDGVFVFAPANVSLSDMSTQQTRYNDSMWRTSLQ